MAVLARLKPNTALQLGVARRFPLALEDKPGLLLRLRGARIRSSRKPRRQQKQAGLAGTFRALSASISLKSNARLKLIHKLAFGIEDPEWLKSI